MLRKTSATSDGTSTLDAIIESSPRASGFIGEDDWRAKVVQLIALNKWAASFEPNATSLRVADELATPAVLGARLRRLIRTRVSDHNQGNMVFKFTASNLSRVVALAVLQHQVRFFAGVYMDGVQQTFY